MHSKPPVHKVDTGSLSPEILNYLNVTLIIGIFLNYCLASHHHYIMKIQYLRHKDIDFEKWDNCIDHAINALPYAYSWYLNITAEEQWDALVIDDYKAVFPLPFKNRVVFKQIYQPFFVQQLGLFYTDAALANHLHYCVEQIPSAFRKMQLQLNTFNEMSSSFVKVKQKITHHIDLHKPYESLLSAYAVNNKRNVKKAMKANLNTVTLNTANELIAFRKKYLAEELAGVQNDNDLERLRKLLEKALSLNKGFIKGVVDEHNQLLALCFILKSNNMLIYLSAVSSEKGKELNAMSLLIDGIIQQYANTDFIFDFEGSMIPGLARYYKGFGGVEKNFPVIQK